MDEYLQILYELANIKAGYPPTEQFLRLVESSTVCKLIEMGCEYAIMEDGTAGFVFGEALFSTTQEDAEKFMLPDWYKYVFDRMMEIDEEPPEKTTTSTAKKAINLEPDFCTQNTLMKKKEDFTFAAAAIRFSDGYKYTNIKVMAAPIDDTNILFWTDNGVEKSIMVADRATVNVGDKLCLLERKQSDYFDLEIRTSPGCSVESKFGYGGNKGHLAVARGGAELHLIPKNYKADASGAANLIWVIKDKNGNFTTGEGSTFQYGERIYKLTSWWEGEERMLNVNIDAF